MGNQVNKPQVLLPNTYEAESVSALRQMATAGEIDIVDRQLAELFRIKNPSKKPEGSEFEEFKANFEEKNTAWVFYPWSNQLLHCLGPEELFLLRTNRNKQLITDEEQRKLAKITVGVTGMSVGSGIALSLAYSGISETIKIADFDELDTSNLNRLREPLLAVGQPKINLAARHIYELNPFADVHTFDKGLDDGNLSDFFQKPQLDVVIDEIDDFKMKVKLRQYAQSQQIPLLMFTSLGDNILVDVERYDLDPNTQLFNGLLGNISEEILQKKDITADDERRWAVTLVGAEYVPTRAIGSLLEMGKTLVGRPQLYSTIAVDGGLCAYVVRQIVLHDRPASGRYFIKFSELFNIDSGELNDTQERQDILKKVLS